MTDVMQASTLEWLLRSLLVLLPGLLAALHALFNKRDPRSALGWVVLCLGLPVLGAVVYAVFGRNRVRRTARRWRLDTSGPDQAAALPAELPGVAVHLSGLEKLSLALSAAPLLAGNRVDWLHDGAQAYQTMLEAIAQAESQVWLSSYIFDTTGIGRGFVEALYAAQARGVEVRVLVDAVGEWYSWPHPVRALRRQGLVAERFNPPRPWSWVTYLNLRNHRKLLVVDNRIAFTGGMNIRNHHVRRRGERAARAEDLHFRLTGPVVQALAELFVEDWHFVSRQPISDPCPGVQLEMGHSHARVLDDGPDSRVEKLSRVIIAAVHQARDRILLITPYFLPPRELMMALQSAALRGVEVKLVLPAQNNLPFVAWASTHILPPLLHSGARIFLYQPTFLHTKLMAVDGSFVQMGSYNLDPRSLRLNFELAVQLHDPAVCQRAEAYVFEKMQASTELTVANLQARSFPVRLRDALSWLFSPYL